MRRARALLLLAGGLLAALLAALWIIPRQLDWNEYRATIEALASASLGHEVRIEGPIGLSVLPEAALSAGGVRVADAGDGVTISARQLRLGIALAPLLAGRVEPRELELLAPRIALPWPPPPDARVMQPPAWLAGLKARISDGKVRIGEMAFSQVEATLATRLDGTSLSGAATRDGQPLRFAIELSRPGLDGRAVLEARAELMDSAFTYTGTLAADGALEGRFAASGEDIARWMPAPSAPFRAQGRLTGADGLIAADELEAEIGGVRAQGAVALRLLPAPRLDVAIALGRLELAAWVRALVGRERGALPMGVDLSAEAAGLNGGQLRRVRLAFDLGSDTTTVREASAVLPGEARLRLAGEVRQGETPRFEGTVSLDAAALRTTLAWLGWAPDWLPPLALRSAQFNAGVTASAGRVALANIEGQLDGTGVTGALGVRSGGRWSVDIGLTLDRLALDPWLAALPDPRRAAGGAELILRLAAGSIEVAGATLQDGALDAGIDGQRVQLRRLEAGFGGGRVAISGALDESGRLVNGLADLTLPEAGALAPLIPASWRGPEAIWRGPLAIRAQASGPAAALAARVRLDLGDLRLEATPTIDLPGRSLAGVLTLRHPGALRVLGLLGLDAGAWLGDGSLALITRLAATPERVEAESFDLVAGGLRAKGALTLDTGPRPRLAGRIAAETLPLPLPYPRDPTPLDLAILDRADAELTVTADQVLLDHAPVLAGLATTLRLQGGALTLDALQAKLAGGELAGRLSVDSTASPPALATEGTLSGATLAGPLFEGAPDLTSGTFDLRWKVAAGGHSALALLSSLAGEAGLAGRDGTLDGFALGGARAALALPETTAIAGAVEAALAGGTTAFTRLEAAATFDRGLATLTSGALESADGTVAVSGGIDLPRGRSELSFVLTPAAEGAPAIGLTLSGPPGAVRRQNDLAALLRWLAERH